MKRTVFWIATALVALVLFGGGIADLIRFQKNVEAMSRLGYPLYLMTIIGVWKLLGTAAILAPGWPRLKEWAYAGAFFNMSGAAISHLFCNEFLMAIGPCVFALLILISWRLRPREGMLANQQDPI